MPDADHEEGHAHSHHHSHTQAHAPASFGRAFAVGIALNAAFVVIELIYGLLAHSLALVADAGLIRNSRHPSDRDDSSRMSLPRTASAFPPRVTAIHK